MLNASAWLAAGSEATYNNSSHILNVTGPTTITADPGTDEPIIQASGSAAVITISTGDDTFVHIGGVDLTDGASIMVVSIAGGATEQNHYVVVVSQENATTSPTFSIDSTSKLDLADNDMIIPQGDLATVQADLAEGRAPGSGAPGGDADGTWTGNGITSSVAAADDAAASTEKYVLAAGLNSDLSTEFGSWNVGGVSESLRNDGNDLLVKFTVNGDVNLDGKVNATDRSILQSNEDDTDSTPGNDYLNGDLNGDGFVDATDAAIQNSFYTKKLPNSPAAPTAFTAVLDSADPRSTIDFSWVPPATTPDHYVLEFSTTGTNFTDLSTPIAGSATTFIDTALTPDTQ